MSRELGVPGGGGLVRVDADGRAQGGLAQGGLAQGTGREPGLPDATLVTRQRLAVRLIHLAEQLAESYRVFASGGTPTAEDSKAFAAHHSACRAALAHLDLLIKLTRLIAPEASPELQPTMMIAHARRALANASPAQLELTAEQHDALDEITLEAATDDELDHDAGVPGHGESGP